jgi:hypothetical protein
MPILMCLLGFFGIINQAQAVSIQPLADCFEATYAYANNSNKFSVGFGINKAFIIPLGSGDSAFLIFNSSGIYSCSVPKQNLFQSLFTPFETTEGDLKKTNLAITIPSRPTYYETYTRQNGELRSVLGTFTSDGSRPDGEWADIKCGEDISESNGKLISDKISPGINTIYDTYLRGQKPAQDKLTSGCSGSLADFRRGFQSFFKQKVVSENDCLRVGRVELIKKDKLAKQTAINALDLCKQVPVLSKAAQDESDKFAPIQKTGEQERGAIAPPH